MEKREKSARLGVSRSLPKANPVFFSGRPRRNLNITKKNNPPGRKTTTNPPLNLLLYEGLVNRLLGVRRWKDSFGRGGVNRTTNARGYILYQFVIQSGF